ncbi:MAG TPA: hypothetical protein VK843_06635 [Planctomycetota bacterium]|nr:hypothetical protein [Planctomycetota bacterium]
MKILWLHRYLGLLLVVSLSLFAAQAAPIGQVCAQCTDEALCDTHLAIETRIISELTAKFATGTADELRPIFDRLVETEQFHINVPSPSLVRFLAQNLEGEERRVFDAKSEDLMHGPLQRDLEKASRFRVAFSAVERCKHPDSERVVISVLDRAVPCIKYPEPNLKSTKDAPKVKPGKKGKPIEGLPEVEKFMKELDKEMAEVVKFVFAHETACEAIRCLAVRKSRAGRAISFDYYRRVAEKSPGVLAELAKPLLSFDAEEAHRLVIDSLAGFRGGLGPEVTEVAGKQLVRTTWGARLHETLVADAASRGLPVPVVGKGNQLGSVWRKWLVENREKIAPGSKEPGQR